MQILQNIPFSIDTEALMTRLCIKPGSDDAVALEELVSTATEIAKPKAGYRVSYIQHKDENSVLIDDVTFTSKALRKNLENIGRVFPFVATCGREVEEKPTNKDDLLNTFWWDTIKEELLRVAIEHLRRHLHKTYRLNNTSQMSPGSGDIAVWPIEEQKLLFGLLGDVKKNLGVELTDSCLMIPGKTISGIIFPTEKDFQSCQVCRRKNCPSRQKPFDQEMWNKLHL